MPYDYSDPIRPKYREPTREEYLSLPIEKAASVGKVVAKRLRDGGFLTIGSIIDVKPEFMAKKANIPLSVAKKIKNRNKKVFLEMYGG